MKKLGGKPVSRLDGVRIWSAWKKIYPVSFIQYVLVSVLPTIPFGGINSASQLVDTNLDKFLFVVFPVMVIWAIIMSILLLINSYLVVDKGMGPIHATVTSIKLMKSHFFSGFKVSLLMSLTLIVGLIPASIGLIWAIPLCMLFVGVFYVRHFQHLDLK